MPRIKHPVMLNVDMGEAYGNFSCGPDDELLPMIDHANIACGFHAGDPLIMANTVVACKKTRQAHIAATSETSSSSGNHVLCGAHPGLPDIQGFGRRAMVMQPDELTAMTRYQIGALKAFLDVEGVQLHHVKPHGALYGMMYKDREVCRAVYKAVPPGVKIFGLAGTIHEEVAVELGMQDRFVAELYGDVKFNSDGTLMIDRKKKAWTAEETERHIRSQVEQARVTAVDGKEVDLPVGNYEVSLCCHSDSPGCVEIVKKARQIIDEFNKENFA